MAIDIFGRLHSRVGDGILTTADEILDTNLNLTQAEINSSISQEISDKIQCHTTAYWNTKSSYVPDDGTIIIYTDYQTKTVDNETVYIPAIKIGSGNAYLPDLAFVGEHERDTLLAHIANTGMHVTAQEKDSWNNKLNVDDMEEVIGEMLIFNRN